jgi:hypothetical protein
MGKVFVMLFSVDLNDAENLQFYRVMFANDEEQLKEKVEVLIRTFAREHGEIWSLDKFWDISKVAFADMHNLVLTDDLIEWMDEEIKNFSKCPECGSADITKYFSFGHPDYTACNDCDWCYDYNMEKGK